MNNENEQTNRRLSDDWEGKFDFLKDYCGVVYLPRTPEISTMQIKEEAGI